MDYQQKYFELAQEFLEQTDHFAKEFEVLENNQQALLEQYRMLQKVSVVQKEKIDIIYKKLEIKL